ncbi:MAG: hypothetical protein M0R46_09570 [Candidatus Muirbacterium halophilum]|nr:hypothetical protein [Candidatus Muirbacterium halophilum]MCK9476157.1 hypothetical protein [Candidatus Muirbacterium halophilum]
MNRFGLLILIFLLLFSFSCKENISYKPITNNGKKWQIAYYQGGDYTSYPAYTKQVVKNLSKLGWIQPFVYPDWKKEVSMEIIWEWLSSNIKSDYIEFKKDGFYCSNWDRTSRAENKNNFLKRLKQNNDIDLVFALGTWAGQDLATDEHSTPVIVMSVTSPVDSKIIPSIKDSGRDHVTTGIAANRFLNQIRLFHDIVDFKNLGVVFENTANGKVFTNYAELQIVSKERDFKLIEAYAPEEKTSEDMCGEKYYNALESIIDKVDAVWIGPHTGSQAKFMNKIANLLIEMKIPSWSQMDNGHVEKGILFSISPEDFDTVGLFEAQKIARILRREKPRDLPIEFSSRLGLSINIDTATKIGFNIPKGVISVADKIYER